MTPKLVILDLDGTVHRAGAATPGAAETLRKIEKLGVVIEYLSNNSTVDPIAKSNELASMGIAAEPSQIKTPASTAARLAVAKGFTNVFAIGEIALRQAIIREGLSLGEEEDALNGRCQAVIVGLDRSANYQKLRAAARSIRDGAAFIATNADKTFPVEQGKLDPGAGSIVEFIKAASGQEPTVIGKPAPTMILDIMAEAKVSPAETLIVGDRIDTDMKAGEAAGARTWLVLTGVEHVIPAGQEGSDDLRGLLSLWP